MRIELISEPNPDLSALEQILYNRGIPLSNMYNYLNPSPEDLSDYKDLGEDKLFDAAKLLVSKVKENKDALVVVDCDTDGYTSGALLINYLHDLFPYWVENHLHWYLHPDKKHGLQDCIDEACKYELVFCPDSSSNDYEYHEKLKAAGGQCIVLDHHLVDEEIFSDAAIIINNQLSNFRNKEISGVGIVWEFCRYLDTLMNTSFSDGYYDLIAIGLIGDMQDLRITETKYLVSKGLEKDNIKNPFIAYFMEKNAYSLSKADYQSYDTFKQCTPMGAAFFVVPFINAMTRSGEPEEQELIFNAMLKFKAFDRIISHKRGANGAKELLVIEALRVATNVKSRQTKNEQEGLALLENKIKEEKLDEDKAICLFLDDDAIDKNIKGLVANKISHKYQKPCLLVAKDEEAYKGSMRGYTRNGVEDFKEELEKCSGTDWVRGHSNAAGSQISLDTNITEFRKNLNEVLSYASSEPVYKVDYIYSCSELVDSKSILEIGKMNDYWGQNIERSLIAVTFKIYEDSLSVYKGNTLSIKVNNNVSIIKFGGTEEEIADFSTEGWKEITAICECLVNRFNGNESPQLKLIDYEIIDSSKFFF